MKQAFTQILVHLDATARSAARLEVACSIAKAQGAALTALYAVTPAVLELPYVPEAGPSVAASLAAMDEERRGAARDRVVAGVAPAEGGAGRGARASAGGVPTRVCDRARSSGRRRGVSWAHERGSAPD